MSDKMEKIKSWKSFKKEFDEEFSPGVFGKICASCWECSGKSIKDFFYSYLEDILDYLELERTEEPALSDSYECGETDGFNTAVNELNKKIEKILK